LPLHPVAKRRGDKPGAKGRDDAGRVAKPIVSSNASASGQSEDGAPDTRKYVNVGRPVRQERK
jgi:hypothetical protein